MKELTNNEAYDIASKALSKKAEKNRKMAEWWQKYIGNPLVTRAAKKGKIKITYLVPSRCLSEYYDLLREKGFRTYADSTIIPFIDEIEIYWNEKRSKL